MGVPGLWKALSPASEERSLAEIAAIEGFEYKRRGIGTIIVGIDASIWLNQTQAVFYTPRHWKTGQNPELRNLFARLGRLLCLAITPVFVFDGPKRPTMKRGKQVGTEPHWLEDTFQTFVAGFGFHSHRAPGEAEAELAHLNRIGAIDAVMTDDVDTFIFGATHIFRNSKKTNKTKDGYDIQVFSADTNATHPEVRLRQEDLFLIAILSGGDYNTGIPNCGVTIARKLVNSGLGVSLFEAAQTLSRTELADFADSWREDIQHALKYDPAGYLGQRYTDLASSIDNTFPNLDIVLHYAKPITSWSPGEHPPNTSLWVPSQPDVSRLIRLCLAKFGWGSLNNVNAQLRKQLWPGCFFQRLVQRPISVLEALRRHVDDGVVIDNPPTLSSFFEIDMVKIMGNLAQSTLSYRVMVSERELLVLVPPLYARAYADEASMGLQPSVNPVVSSLSSINTAVLSSSSVHSKHSASPLTSPEPVDSVPKMTLWVPSLFLERTLPRLVDHYKKKKRPVASPRRAPVFPQITAPYSSSKALIAGNTMNMHHSDPSGSRHAPPPVTRLPPTTNMHRTGPSRPMHSSLISNANVNAVHRSDPSRPACAFSGDVNMGSAKDPIDLTQESVVLGQCLACYPASAPRNCGMVSVGFIDMTVDETEP